MIQIWIKLGKTGPCYTHAHKGYQHILLQIIISRNYVIIVFITIHMPHVIVTLEMVGCVHNLVLIFIDSECVKPAT